MTQLVLPAGLHSLGLVALEAIAGERARQVMVEGLSAEHDDEHRRGEIADAAACYAATRRAFAADVIAGRGYQPFTRYLDLWPWSDEWWKPKSRRRDLVRAGALIVAEIERLARLEEREASEQAILSGAK